MKKVISMAAALAVTACAKNTSEISSQYVSPLVYADYNCRQLGAEAQRITSRVGELTHSIDENASGDSVAMGVGLVLFWPALFFIDGDTPEAQEYARLKGEYSALEKSAIKKDCDIGYDENPFIKAEREHKQKQKETREKSAYPSNRRGAH